MCGRLSLTAADHRAAAAMLADLIPSFDAARLSCWLERADYRPRYNVGPGQPHWVVRTRERRTILDRATWGFELRERRKLVFNARAETIEGRPMFRTAFTRGGRCLIPADGFFEWDQIQAGRQPWWFRGVDGRGLLFAAVLAPVRGADGRSEDRFAIVTTAADESLAAIHDRMPAIVEPEAVDRWLFGEAKEARELLLQGHHALRGVPVSRRVNAVAHDDPGCIEAVDVPASEQLELGA